MAPADLRLLVEIGEVLPQDLRQRVAAGQLDQASAKELAKARAREGIARSQMSFREQQAVRARERDTAQAASAREAAVVQAAATWEQQQRQRDPEFPRIYEEIQREVLLVMRRDGRPDTPEGVQRQLDAALRSVKGRISGYRGGRRPELNPLVGGSVAGSPRGKPQTVLEAVQRRGSAG